jgi:hypothetical protein
MKRNEKCCYREVLEQWQARAAHWASRFCENREIIRLYLLDSNARRERESENITILELLRKKKILHTLASSLTCSCFCCTKIAKRACWSFFFCFPSPKPLAKRVHRATNSYIILCPCPTERGEPHTKETGREPVG